MSTKVDRKRETLERGMKCRVSVQTGNTKNPVKLIEAKILEVRKSVVVVDMGNNIKRCFPITAVEIEEEEKKAPKLAAVPTAPAADAEQPRFTRPRVSEPPIRENVRPISDVDAVFQMAEDAMGRYDEQLALNRMELEAIEIEQADLEERRRALQTECGNMRAEREEMSKLVEARKRRNGGAS